MTKFFFSLRTFTHLSYNLGIILCIFIWNSSFPVKAQMPERNPQWAEPIYKPQNLYRINDKLFRSSQPIEENLSMLQELGIKTVLSLRAFHSNHALLKNSGIKLIQVKIYTWNIKDKQVVAALRALKAAESNGPVLLHCQHGADRTGLISAMYRILYQNWSREQALEELRKGGYGHHSMWKNIPKYLRTVDIEKIRSLVEQP